MKGWLCGYIQMMMDCWSVWMSLFCCLFSFSSLFGWGYSQISLVHYSQSLWLVWVFGRKVKQSLSCCLSTELYLASVAVQVVFASSPHQFVLYSYLWTSLSQGTCNQICPVSGCYGGTGCGPTSNSPSPSLQIILCQGEGELDVCPHPVPPKKPDTGQIWLQVPCDKLVQR